jgi:hypothetical protein
VTLQSESCPWPGVRLYVGADAGSIHRRRYNLTGHRCFSAAGGPRCRYNALEAAEVIGLLDSGAFSDAPGDRLTPLDALQRQLDWEREAQRFWAHPWRAAALVSYDLLIDEKWSGRKRKKRRWSVSDADRAVRVTVEAATFLAKGRPVLAPRQLCLACQGVDAAQYEDCVKGVLACATPQDIIGLGGWCIIG